jgi:hypothetical protein
MHRPQNRIQQRDDRNRLTILLAMSGDIRHNSTGHGKAAAPFDEIGDTTILQLTRPWNHLSPQLGCNFQAEASFQREESFECG